MPHEPPPPAAAGPAFRPGLLVLLAFTAVYLPVTCRLADRAPLWYDELFTVHLSRLANPDLWRALSTGTDASPPLYHLLTRYARLCLGESELATRAPAILGFWVLSVGIYAFVRRRCRRGYAVAAMLLPLATPVYPMAYNARAYGWLLGCCGAALVCWQSAAEGERRRAALAGLAASAAGAFGSHYYAFLALAPLGAGEIARTVARRRVDVPVWLALAAGPLTLAALLPLALGAWEGMGPFRFVPAWSEIPHIYAYLLRPARWPLAAVAAVAVLGPLYDRRSRRPEPPAPGEAPSAIPAHEWAAALAFAAIPVIGVCVGRWVTGVFTARYAAPAVIGWAVALAFLADRRFGDRRWVAVPLAGAFLVGFAQLARRDYDAQSFLRVDLAQTFDYFARHGGAEQTVVVSDPFEFLQLVYYAPPAVRANLVYLRNEEAARRLNSVDPRDWALGQLRRWADVPVHDYRAFVAARDRFLVYRAGGWLRPTLQADGFRFRPHDGTDELYEASNCAKRE